MVNYYLAVKNCK